MPMKRTKVFTLRLSDDEFERLKYFARFLCDNNISAYLRQSAFYIGQQYLENQPRIQSMGPKKPKKKKTKY